MKYASTLPITALIALSLIALLVNLGVIPPGAELLELLKSASKDGIFWLVFLIILLESIIYVGFYFPGQFFAVLIVVGANPSLKDIGLLTLAMVLAATVGSFINFMLGKHSNKKEAQGSDTSIEQESDPSKPSIPRLLLAMIHINSLAFFMFSQGAKHNSIKIVALAGLFNLPYYLLLIAGTAVLSEQVLAMAENTYILAGVILVWLLAALYFDIKAHRKSV